MVAAGACAQEVNSRVFAGENLVSGLGARKLVTESTIVGSSTIKSGGRRKSDPIWPRPPGRALGFCGPNHGSYVVCTEIQNLDCRHPRAPAHYVRRSIGRQAAEIDVTYNLLDRRL